MCWSGAKEAKQVPRGAPEWRDRGKRHWFLEFPDQVQLTTLPQRSLWTVKFVFIFKFLKTIKSLFIVFFFFQRFHRWREDRGAKAGQGRRDQHLLRGFGASLREVPQVGVRDVTGQRKGIAVSTKNPRKLTSRRLLIQRLLILDSLF